MAILLIFKSRDLLKSIFQRIVFKVFLTFLLSLGLFLSVEVQVARLWIFVDYNFPGKICEATHFHKEDMESKDLEPHHYENIVI